MPHNHSRTRRQTRAAHRWTNPEADRLREVFRGDYASQPQLVEVALGKQAFALLRQLEAACLAADELAEAGDESLSNTRIPKSS